MPLPQLDRILSIEPGQSVRAAKSLSLAEDYLQDHFPRFPVMPGVLMLESLFQAGAWLLRVSDDFAKPLIELREAKGIKYQGFVAPGDRLEVELSIAKQEGDRFVLKGSGSIDGRTAVSGRLVLERVELATAREASGPYENYVREELRRQWRLLAPSPVA